MRIIPYQNYKDSGVEWLGGVPKHWDVQWLKTSVANGVDQTSRSRDARWMRSGRIFWCWSRRVRGCWVR